MNQVFNLDNCLYEPEFTIPWEIKNMRIAGGTGLQRKGSRGLTHPPLF